MVLTRHHLIPKTRHRNRRVQQQFTRQDMQTRILNVCQPCHHHIHHVVSEKELALHYNTLEKLLQHPDISQFIGWLANKPAGFKPRSAFKRR